MQRRDRERGSVTTRSPSHMMMSDAAPMHGVETLAHNASAPLRPFDDRTLGFFSALSRTLATDRSLRAHGEVQALAFWLRPTEMHRLTLRFAALEGHESILVPRGTVFHVPPANVDTLFVYSWALSLLTGNRNIVRLSQRMSGIGEQVAHSIQTVLRDPAHAAVAAHSVFVHYGHDAERTRTLSALCDVRVLWGGDAAITQLRSAPLPPHAVELVFPDRYSMSAIACHAYSALNAAARDDLADRFANDAFWFDQRACASPRLVIWIGTEDAMQQWAPDFWTRVATAAARRGVHNEAGTSLTKFAVAAQCAVDEDVAHLTRYSPEVQVLELRSLHNFARATPGGGLFHHVAMPSLVALAPWLSRRDQTLAAFGFTHNELRDTARHFNGIGIDRFVPIGHALAFHHVWDGYDLLQQFTRRVCVPPLGW
jgi:hypothetical protein